MTNEEVVARRAELTDYFAEVKKRRAEIAAKTKALTAQLATLKTEGIGITNTYQKALNEYFHLGNLLNHK
jgi:uncharacterized coiled-coil DUF342 family protein